MKFIHKLGRFLAHEEVLLKLIGTLIVSYLLSLCCIALFPFWAKIIILIPIFIIIACVFLWSIYGIITSIFKGAFSLWHNVIRIWNTV